MEEGFTISFNMKLSVTFSKTPYPKGPEALRKHHKQETKSSKYELVGDVSDSKHSSNLDAVQRCLCTNRHRQPFLQEIQDLVVLALEGGVTELSITYSTGKMVFLFSILRCIEDGQPEVLLTLTLKEGCEISLVCSCTGSWALKQKDVSGVSSAMWK